MRIWDLDPSVLCDRHLLGEHRELHAIWSVIANNKKGYAKHPETERWRGKLAALYERHEALVKEFSARGFRHNSPLNKTQATGLSVQDTYVDTVTDQIMILRKKGCKCRV
ncbi:MAG: pyrimidine dimer DNA glycosylase/endonuclease V [Thermoprotei archaeon]